MSKKTHALGANVGIVLGVLFNIYLWLYVPEIFWFWWNAIGCFITVGIGILISQIIKRKINKANDVIVTLNNSDGTIKKVIQGASNSSEANSLSFDSLSYSDNGSLNLSGKAKPGSKIDVYIGQKLVGTAYADSEGFWNIILDKPVNPGDYIKFESLKNMKEYQEIET